MRKLVSLLLFHDYNTSISNHLVEVSKKYCLIKSISKLNQRKYLNLWSGVTQDCMLIRVLCLIHDITHQNIVNGITNTIKAIPHNISFPRQWRISFQTVSLPKVLCYKTYNLANTTQSCSYGRHNIRRATPKQLWGIHNFPWILRTVSRLSAN